MGAVGAVNTPAYIPMGLTALDISTPCAGPPCPVPAVKWTFPTIGKVDQTPALGRDGTLYVPAINGGEKRLYAVKPANRPPTHKWTFGPINTGSETSAQPIVGGDDTVYVGLGNTIYALNPATGSPTTPPTQLWTYATTNFIQSSPLIGPVTNGRAILYVPSRDHNLYAISSPRPEHHHAHDLLDGRRLPPREPAAGRRRGTGSIGDRQPARHVQRHRQL